MTRSVLIVTPWFPSHPADYEGNFVLHSAQALLREGVSAICLVCRPWVPGAFGLVHSDWVRAPLHPQLFAPDLHVELARFLSVPRSRLNELFGPLFRLGVRPAVRRIVLEHRIRLIHVHTESIGYAMFPIARELGVPLVITLHGINTEPRLLNTMWKMRRLKEALRCAARVVLVGEPLVAHFGSLAGGTSNFRVVHNGFRLDDERLEVQRQAWGETLRFVSVSNLHEGKGIELNLQALARLADDGIHNWTYAIVGDGAQRVQLEEITHALGLKAKVAFLGRLTHDRVLKQLAHADVFVLPSYREAFGIAYLEAMASGLLAIGVSGQGPEAFIRNGETGLLVKPKDAGSLLDTLKSLFQDYNGMQRIAQAGRLFASTEFTWRRHAEKLIAVYDEILGGE